MTPMVTFRAATEDDNLLGTALKGNTWGPWKSLLLASMGEPLIGDELLAFRHMTGREEPPRERIEELVVVAGRRGGKTLAASALACYIGGLCDHSDTLAKGERGLVLLIAPDQRQARIALDYAEGILTASPVLAPMISGRKADTISLGNRIDIEVRAASFRRLRGMTCVAVIADESCFWATDDGSANPDSEILTAVRPALATTRGPLVVISTPYAKRGETWRLFKENFGPEGDPRILVARGTSREFNPSLPQSVVDRALARDPEGARAEYLGEWRSDIAAYVDRTAVEACVAQDCRERPFERGQKYVGFVDPSGGSSDAMTLAVAHHEKDRKEGERIVVDLIREARPPFSPGSVVVEFSRALEPYNIRKIYGDRYAGEWPREAFRKRGIQYEPAVRPKNDLYVDLLPLLNAGNIVLPDHPRLVNELAGLERRVTRGGRDSIDHAPAAHDDLANAVAGAAWAAQGAGRRGEVHIGAVTGLY